MTNDRLVAQSHLPAKRKTCFSLKSLLVILTFCAILLAWLADHRRLAKQIPAPPQKWASAYRLSNLPVELLAKQLEELFEPGTIVVEPKSNSVIVNATEINQQRIGLLLRLLDAQSQNSEQIRSSDNNVLIRSGEAPGVGWSRNTLCSWFITLHRSVIRRQTGFAARITRTLFG